MAMETLLFILAIAVTGVLIYAIQRITSPLVKKANRSLLNRNQYQEQQAVTRQTLRFTAAAPLEEVHRQLSRYVVAKEEKGFATELYIAAKSNEHITYVLGGKMARLFAAEMRFEEQEGAVNAVFHFTRWLEHDGVASSDTLARMKELIDAVTKALQAADPNVQISSFSQ